MNTLKKMACPAIALALLFISCSSSSHSVSDLEQHITDRLDSVNGTFAVAFISLDGSSRTLLINGKEMFHAASTMKTPVMVELFKQAEAGKFSLNDSMLVKNEFRSIVDSS